MIKLIHTFEMLLKVNYIDIQKLFSLYGINTTKYSYFGAAVKHLSSDIKQKHTAYTVTWVSYQGNDDWNIHLKIDATKLLGRGDILETDYELIESKIRMFLTQYFGHSDYFDSHTLTRIDYKVDVKLPNPKERELLFHLMEKYTNRYCYKEKIKWGLDGNGKPFKYETSQYHNNKSVGLIIYSKEEERKAKGEIIQPYEEDVVRYELRLLNNHLNNMKRSDKGKSRPKKLRVYFSSRLHKEYMEKHVLPIVRKGDFYKIYEADKLIENSEFTRMKKDKLRSFLVMISKGSLDTPKKHMSRPTYRKYLQDLESLGINPVLIPKNRTDFPNFMKNPFPLSK